MKIVIKNNISGIDAEFFVIKIFDAIKCAAATGNTVNIWLDRKEVQDLVEHIKAVNWIEINEDPLNMEETLPFPDEKRTDMKIKSSSLYGKMVNADIDSVKKEDT